MKNIFKILSTFLFLGISAYANVSYAQQKQVTGRVMDINGELLIGVNVVEANTLNGTVTDVNGTYVLKLTTDNPVLKFSYVGFKAKEVEVKKEGIIDVTLDENLEMLDEVVVVGFGTQKKASVVGSISSISPELLQKSPSRSLSNNLAGMVSGVIAVQRSGNPWFNNSDFWIRGISTFNSTATPLVLVDGIERSLHDLDPEEIASFSVLKDAAASAVYGVRGANGVIMINTKRGSIGKPQVNFRIEQSVNAPIKIPDYVGSVKYLELMNEMYLDSGRAPFVDEATLLNYKYQTDPELYPDVDWWDVVSKDYSKGTKANLSVNGGNDFLRYSMVLGYFHEDGITEVDPNQEWDSSLKVDRYTVRTNVDVNLTSTTLLRVNLGGLLQTKNAPPGNDETNFGIFFQAMRIPPYLHPPIYSDGSIPRVFAKENPYAWATQRGYERINNSKIESLTALEQDLKFVTPGLSAKLTFSFDKFSSNWVTRSKNPDYYIPATARDENGNLILNIQANGEQFLGHTTDASWGDQSVYLEGMFAYDRTFSSVHAINAMVLYNQRSYDNGSAQPFRTQGFAGRLSYSYDRKYVAEFNFGYNGSENFAKGKRYGFFPAVAAGWVVSQESFMEPLKPVVSNLKIRGSWGEAGNSEIGRNPDGSVRRRFAYLATIADLGAVHWGSASPFVYRLGRAEGEIGIPDLTWETSAKSNIGMDIGLWNNAISYTVDVFMEKRRDIFLERTNLPGSAGFIRAPWANFGKVENRGIDMSLNANKQINDDWFVSVMANYTYARNKITEQDEPLGKLGTYRAQTGKPIGQIFGLIAEGLFTEDDFVNGTLKDGIPVQNYSEVTNLRPGDIKYRDMDNSGSIDVNDQTAIGGTVVPEIIYGFGATVKYKAVDFGFFFQGAGKAYRLLGGENWLPGSVQGAGNIWYNVDDRWTPENPSQNVFWPRLGDMTVSNNTQASTWWLQDMSFLRLKNVELGYTFPNKWTTKIGIRDCRIFVRGTNVLTFSKFKMWDPELETTDGLRYPQMQTFSIGLNVNFNN